MTEGGRTFAVTTCQLWNSLSLELRNLVSLGEQGWCMGSRGGVVVRALASHQCGPGLSLGLGVICALSLLLVLSLLREVFLRVLRFPPLLKNQHSKFQLKCPQLALAC